MAGPPTSWLILLHHPAVQQELRWFGLFALGVGVAVVVGADAVLAVGLGLMLYALWHLAQAVRLLALLLDDRGPQVRRVWGIWGEVFNRVRAVRLRQSKRKRRQKRFFSRFREAVAAMPDGVMILGGDGEISWLNQPAEVYFGLHNGVAIGRKLGDLVKSPVLREYLEAADFVRALELEAPGDPAVILAVSMNRFRKGRQRYLLLARDITRLYHLDRTRRDFTLNVSHELRTPLTVMHGYLETLVDAEDERSPRRRPLLQMLEQARRMQSIIQDLSMLSRLEEGAEPLQHAPVAVLDILEDIVDEGRELARGSHHALRLSADPKLILLGDESLLRCAFSNLIFNAIRHTPMRTQVDIRWGRDGDAGTLTVTDNGQGIAARHLARLTERFYRVDAGRSRDAGGSGLGLAIVRHILDVHDARLQISSEEGRGSSFSCLFPASRTVNVSEPFDGA